MSNVIFAPNHPTKQAWTSVFLAGSIDMGKAVEWQTKVADQLSDLDVNIYNPRRTDWDSSWVQSINNIQFLEQVEWEHHYLESAAIVFFYFDPASQAPITLMELGYVIGLDSAFADKDIVVVCPLGYWRKGNVDILCASHEIRVCENLDEGIAVLKKLVAAE